jgi:hypothetical protein
MEHAHTHIQYCDLISLPSFQQKRQEDNKAEAQKGKLYFCSLQYQKWYKFYNETEKDGDMIGNSIGNLGNGVETPAARADLPTKETAAACYSVHSHGEVLQGGDSLVCYDCQLKTASTCVILQYTTFL